MKKSEQRVCVGCMQRKDTGGVCPKCGFDARGYTPEPRHLPAEMKLNGRYLIGRAIGNGSFSITYIAWDQRRQRRVAIKEYFPIGLVTRDHTRSNTVKMIRGRKKDTFLHGRSQFEEEANKLLAYASMPGIVSVYDAFLQNETAYMVMEYIDGMPLDAFATQMGGSLQPERVLKIMRQPIAALAQLHAAGLTHRDIYPRNVLVDHSEQAHLIDFGVARVLPPQQARSKPFLMIRDGYAADQTHGVLENQHPCVDVYAICATIYQAITGRIPPDASARAQNDTLTWPSHLGVEMDARQEAAMLKGLAIDASDRFQSMTELYEALYEERLAIQPPKSTAAKPKKKSRWVFAVILLLILAAVGGGAYILLRDPGVQFIDATFEQMLREAMDRPTGRITSAQLARVKSLTIQGDSLTLSPEPPPDSWSVQGDAFGSMASYEDLRHFTSLQQLHIQDQGTPDIAPIGALQSLTSLALCHCDLEDLSALSGLTSLTSLYLSANRIADLSPLSSLSLTHLDIRQNAVADLQPLAAMTSLESIALDDNLMEDWMPVEHVADVSGRPDEYAPIAFEDSAFEQMLREALGKPEGAIRGMDLAAYTALTINAGSLMFEIQPQGVFESGEQGNVTSIADLRHFSSLRQLYLANNSIEDFSPLSSLTGLTYLLIGNCSLRTLPSFAALERLDALYLYDNNIQNISALAGLQVSRLGLNDNAVTDLSPLAEMTTLTHLFVDNNRIRDLSALANLKALNTLHARGNPITDWTPVAHVQEVYSSNVNSILFADEVFEELLREALDRPGGFITEAELADIQSLSLIGNALSFDGEFPQTHEPGERSRIRSFEDLKYFTGITRLYLANHSVTSLQGFDSLEQLTDLSVLSCSVQDIAALSSLQALSALNLEDNQITDLSPLSRLKLSSLNLRGNAIDDVRPLSGMSSLAALDLSKNYIEEISALSGLDEHISLNLNENQVADWSPVRGMADVQGRPAELSPIAFADDILKAGLLKALGKAEDGFITLPELAVLEHMTIIGDAVSLSQHEGVEYEAGERGHIASLQDLAYCTALRTLYLQDLPISDLSPLETLTNLTDLSVLGCDVENIGPLRALRQVERLDIRNNKIQDISALEAMPLQQLNAEGNRINDLSALAQQPALTEIRLRGNQITDISPISALQITTLDVAENAIEDISALEAMGAIEALDLAGNPIEDWSPVAGYAYVPGRPATYDPVVFADAALERMLCEALNREKGSISGVELSKIEYLTVIGDRLTLSPPDDTADDGEAITRGQLQSLEDLQYFTGLRALHLQENRLRDITPIGLLTSLTSLALDSCDMVDITPVQSLKGLTAFSAKDNRIVSIDALSELSVLTTLDLRGNDIRDIKPLSGLTALTDLSLRDNAISDLTPLAGLNQLKTLDVSGNRIEDWSAVASLPLVGGRPAIYDSVVFKDEAFERLIREAMDREDGFITPVELSEIEAMTLHGNTLSLSLNTPPAYEAGEYGQVTTLADLAYFTGLKDLYIQDNLVEDLSPLAELKDLNYLMVGNCGISDITPLANLTKLEYLFLFDNRVQDLAPLSGLPLTRLALSRNDVRDIKALGSIETLQWLWLASNDISDIAPLAGLPKLTHLYLSSNMIRDIGPLAGLDRLSVLYLVGNPVKDWQPVSHVPEVYGGTPEDSVVSFVDPVFERLIRLALEKPTGDIAISDLMSIEAMAIIGDTLTLTADFPETYAVGERGSIASLTDLRHFTGLSALYIQDQPVSDIMPISFLQDLTYLMVGNCDVQDISSLAELKNLKYLYLYDNRVDSLEALSATPLVRLGLSRNVISDITPLRSITTLTDLWLTGNNVVDIMPLSGHKSLASLYLAQNSVEDISALETLPSLTTLYLAGNPVEDWTPVAKVAELFGRPAEHMPIAFADEAFEQLLRGALGKPKGIITPRELSGITEMEIDGGAMSFALGTLSPSRRSGKIASLADLRHFSALTRLVIRNHTLEDISGLEGLVNLRYLAITDCAVADLSPLASLVNLERLGLQGNRITDISPLAALPGLTHLYVGENEIASLEPLSKLTQLAELNISGNPVEDLAPLASLGALSAFYCVDTLVMDWSPMLYVDRVIGRPQAYAPIVFADETFEAMLREALSSQAPLTVADLLGIEDMMIVGDRMLLSLDASAQEEEAAPGHMRTLSDLAHFKGLKRLYIRSQPVESIEPVGALQGLVYLVLTDCNVTDLSPLTQKTITQLGLYQNNITDIQPLAALTGVTHLYLGDNDIEDLTPLNKHRSLVYLNATNNRITNVKPLARIPGLKDVFLQGNLVEDWTPLEHILRVEGR